jgi:hypothetical protein
MHALARSSTSSAGVERHAGLRAAVFARPLAKTVATYAAVELACAGSRAGAFTLQLTPPTER